MFMSQLRMLMQYQPPTPKTIEQLRGGFLRAMSDAGLKPTVVYHNLTPAELYEKVWWSVLKPLKLDSEAA